ncbi:retrovirus-related Pol polyprotein from transposon 17.6 [Trichonephila clavipes]|nr:retrovirus-related Pol polyprotein from transposon 17.6 [Trichonephila clavipes]
MSLHATCAVNYYKNALPAGRLIPIVSNYPNEIVTLDLLGPYHASKVRRTPYALVITDHFRKWAEIIPLKKASARVIADNFFVNYISHFGTPVKLIIDNGPQFMSDIFEHLSDRLGIRHVKTVLYRPQSNRTERVNRDLLQMIANYVNDQHDTWDQFLQFSDGIGRNLICTKREIERLFDEARRNIKAKHGKWGKYYNRRRLDVQIKVNDWVLIKTPPLSSATKKVVAIFKPKFEGPNRVLEVKNNNIVIWRSSKRLKVNVDQVRIYRQRKCDEMEIRAGSSNSNSSRHKWSSFERVQRRSNDSMVGRRGQVRKLKRRKKETIGYKRLRDSGSGGPERKQREGQKHEGEKRQLTVSSSNELQCPRKRYRGDEIVMPSTSGYNLKPRKGTEVES